MYERTYVVVAPLRKRESQQRRTRPLLRFLSLCYATRQAETSNFRVGNKPRDVLHNPISKFFVAVFETEFQSG